MRPIELRWKGINSFREEQRIDFAELTSQGLFGIFGPTGSGKSSILDAMILALYAKLPRSTKNFVNTNETNAFVSFRFQICGVSKKEYIVERSFKYNKNTQSVRNTSGRLIQIEGKQEIIQADRATEVTKQCVELLGLSADDFMRTVVLPQGQFSDFLKLKNTDRRNMLQRIFHLEQYGVNLTTRISSAKQKQELLLSKLQGELCTYNEMNEEKIALLEGEQKEKQEEVLGLHEQKEVIHQEYQRVRERYQLQEELNLLLTRQEERQKERLGIENKKKKLILSQQAKQLLPFWEQMEDAKKEYEQVKRTDSEKKTIEIYDEEIREIEFQLNECKVDGPLLEALEFGVAKEKEVLNEKLAFLQKQQDMNQTEELARQIRRQLQAGECCPVCGGEFHTTLKKIEVREGNSDPLRKEREELNKLEQALQSLREKWNVTSFDEAFQDYRKQEVRYNELSKVYFSLKDERQKVETSLKVIVEKQQYYKKSSCLYEEQRALLGFSQEEPIQEYYLLEEESAAYQKEIQKYESDMVELEQKIKYVQSKQQGEVISEEVWLQVKKQYEEIQRVLDFATGELTLLAHKIKESYQKLQEKRKLEEKLDKVEHKKSIIKELETLFRGNTFIEYMAQSRLVYIAKESSALLHQITNGKYSLEVNEDAEFMIRDYNNGGVLRPCDTLSGGETFVVSLALALALSSTIQLNGSAPLELFFLDEGFGSLDEELLDVVMNSLEKLQHQKRSIGIISHVESIQNRVPRKIIINPSEEKGSTIKMEYN